MVGDGRAGGAGVAVVLVLARGDRGSARRPGALLELALGGDVAVDQADEGGEAALVLERGGIVVGDGLDDRQPLARLGEQEGGGLDRPFLGTLGVELVDHALPAAARGQDLLGDRGDAQEPFDDEVDLRVDHRRDDLRPAHAVGGEIVLEVLDRLHDVLLGDEAFRIVALLRAVEVAGGFQHQHLPERAELGVALHPLHDLALALVEDGAREHGALGRAGAVLQRQPGRAQVPELGGHGVELQVLAQQLPGDAHPAAHHHAAVDQIVYRVEQSQLVAQHHAVEQLRGVADRVAVDVDLRVGGVLELHGPAGVGALGLVAVRAVGHDRRLHVVSLGDEVGQEVFDRVGGDRDRRGLDHRHQLGADRGRDGAEPRLVDQLAGVGVEHDVVGDLPDRLAEGR